MKLSSNFPAQIALVLLAAALLLTYPLSAYGSAEILTAVVAGALLSTVNVLAGYWAISYSFDKSYTTFMKAVLGGMGIRMLVMLGTLAALILLAHLQPVALMSSLLGFYLVYLILEILYIQRRITIKNRG